MLARMAKQLDTVLLACGSFNPITYMHLRMFELAKDYLHKETHHKVVKGILSPVSNNYPTSKKLAHWRHRCDMIERSLTPLHGVTPWITLDTWECGHEEWKRTGQVMDYHFDQLNAHKDKSQSEISLKLLCGADMFESFNIPDLWSDEDIEKIAGKYGMVVITREGFDPWKTLLESSKSKILVKHKNNIQIVVDKCVNSVSSTYIRDAIKKGESIRYLLPDCVIEYITENKLFQ